MFLEVVKAEYISDYRIKLWFNNQVSKIVDLQSSLKGHIFTPLKDLTQFKQFTVKYNTIEWPNGADFAPEFLYDLPAYEEDIDQLCVAENTQTYNGQPLS
ncbi:MAG: DUF2442 domain-containing protein [Bacteroidales bacterium]|nr:DUF2442 domain-containing protein [Bacteroidales bacterium]